MEKGSRAFTLIELIMVIVIVGVLAGLAIPSYVNTVESARQNEARTVLQIIRTAERIYALNHAGATWDPADPQPLATINTTLNTDITTQYYDVTVINGLTTATFTATAKRNAAQGGNNASTVTIDSNGNFTYA